MNGSYIYLKYLDYDWPFRVWLAEVTEIKTVSEGQLMTISLNIISFGAI